MDCKDDSITVLLADYFFGQLEEPGRRKVEEHLSGCDASRRSLSVMELLSKQARRSKDTVPATPISSDLLRPYFEDKSQLDPQTLWRITERLESDRELRLELEFLTGLERDMTAAVSSAMRSSTPPARGWRQRSSWMR